MSDRITEAELERIERVDQACIPSRGTQHDDPDNSGLCIYCGSVLDEEGAVERLAAEVRRLRRLIVAGISPAVGRSEQGGFLLSEDLEEEAREIQAEEGRPHGL